MENNKSNSFFDLQGNQTGFPFGKQQVLGILAAILGYIIIAVLPFGSWGLAPQGQTIFAILVFTVVLYVTNGVPSMMATFMMIILLVLTKTMGLNDILANIGTSPMLMIMGLLIVSKGMTNTTLAARVSYLFICKLGTSPLKLIIALLCATALISTCIADIPSCALIGTVAYGILKEMNEDPGTSRLGRGLMLGIPMASCLGGLALINGSGINVAGLAILDKITNGQYVVSYTQWAAVGIPFAIIMILPLSFCVYYCFGIHKPMEGRIQLTTEHFEQKLRDLGPLNNPEKRFLITLVLMMILFVTSDITKFSIPLISFMAMCAVISPGFGTVNINEAQKTIPWDTLFLIAAGTALAVGVSTTGFGDWIAAVSMGWATGFSLLALVVLVLVVCFLSHLVIVGSASSVVNIMIPATLSIALGAGVHPGLIALAVISAGTASTLMPIDATILITYGYGYYKYADLYKLGPVLTVIWVVVASLVISIIAPMVGLVM